MKKTKPTNLVRLYHIRDYCEKIKYLINGFDAEKFEQDERTTLAVTRCIEIIGESAYKMDKEVKMQYPNIPWVSIEGMRHRIAHEYYDLDDNPLACRFDFCTAIDSRYYAYRYRFGK